ncbi:MAG: SUMF1/EgtB/PvdO family nonheme iron enzyme [Gammaproteobacteria bacterium]|jgi:DNA-binding winged helix-turn-helix (wHTH) protein/predicted esterase|nr:SUMF1/EgtB/PvdO family nonheme iron enzyme [Gammaproteobacteria bacterium]
MKYRFGDFELDPNIGVLNGPAGPVALRRQTFRLLESLLRHAPNLVDRDTLLDEAWGRSELSPNVLPQAISELRHALGDSASESAYIETRHRRGYRIVPAVEPIESGPSIHGHAGRPPRRSVHVLSILTLVSLPLALVAAWWWQGADERWLENHLLPAVEEQIETDVTTAWRLVREARERLPNDARLEQLWRDLTLPLQLDSEPSGVQVEVAGYGDGPADWLAIGTTPLETRLPLSALRFRISRPGFASRIVAPSVLPFPELFRLHPADEVPEDMVFVPPGASSYRSERRDVPGFWIDRHEVTNEAYLEFVEAGGYADTALWPDQIQVDGQVLDRESLLARMVDQTGMHGPSTWTLGTFPEGDASHPVSGISAHEAAAYASWAGKSLPTAFHWYRAAGLGSAQTPVFSGVLKTSNFGLDGSRPVGSGLGPYGTYDMAGNVREWTRTSYGALGYALGAASSDHAYQFADWQLFEPLSREPGFGMRLIKPIDPFPPELLADIGFPSDPAVAPVDDATFEIYARLYDYDDMPLRAEFVSMDDDHAAWRRERIEFDAAYGNERVILQLFIPHDVAPPYQTVVHFPGGDARLLKDSREAGLLQVEPFLRTGRAVAFPVYKGTFERAGEPVSGPIGVRDLVIQQVKDVRRTLDYLESRDDIDTDRLVFHGLSYGAVRSMFILAVEERFRAALIISTGLIASQHLPPEIQQVDYLPRVTLPVLFVTGRNDLSVSYETAQRPFFEQLGTPDAQKTHVALDWGHLPPGYSELTRLMIEWTDRWLGPVEDGRFALVDSTTTP